MDSSQGGTETVGEAEECVLLACINSTLNLCSQQAVCHHPVLTGEKPKTQGEDTLLSSL